MSEVYSEIRTIHLRVFDRSFGHTEEENVYLPEFQVICSAFLLLPGFDYLGVARWFK